MVAVCLPKKFDNEISFTTLQERKTFLYPFCVLFLIELFMVVLRDMYLVISGDGWYKTAFFNVTLPLLLCKFELIVFFFVMHFIILSQISNYVSSNFGITEAEAVLRNFPAYHNF